MNHLTLFAVGEKVLYNNRERVIIDLVDRAGELYLVLEPGSIVVDADYCQVVNGKLEYHGFV